MVTLIDTSLWVEFARFRSPSHLKRFVAPYILDSAAHVAEPIVFEVLRHARPNELELLTRQFAELPMLSTPDDLWSRATALGRACRDKGYTAGSLDLLIASIALCHEAVLVTLDTGFYQVAKYGHVQVKVLQRP